jgi:hypothetical protein
MTESGELQLRARLMRRSVTMNIINDCRSLSDLGFRFLLMRIGAAALSDEFGLGEPVRQSMRSTVTAALAITKPDVRLCSGSFLP